MSATVLNLVKDLHFLVHDKSGKCDNKISELLSQINSLSISEINSTSIASRNEIMFCITLINPTRLLMVEKSVSVICFLCASKKLTIEFYLFERMLIWLENALRNAKRTNMTLSTKILRAIKIMLQTEERFIPAFLESVLHPQKSLILHSLDEILNREQESSSCGKQFEIIMDILNLFLNDESKTNRDMEFSLLKQNILKVAADHLLRVYFTKNPLQGAQNFMFLPVLTFPFLSKTATLFPEYAELHIAELLGLVKAYMHFDHKEYKAHQVRKLQMSPQSLYNLLEETCELNLQETGKRISKTHKPKLLTKNPKSVDLTNNSSREICIHSIGSSSFKLQDPTEVIISDYETESNRNNCAIRLSALSLMEVLVKSLQINIFYGYWHAFFPNNSNYREGILYCVISDSNDLCRTTALKIATQMICSAKKFLEQAETNEKIPTSYLTFSLSLGQMIHTMYKTLSQAIANESSTAILANVLKCLAVLVQATPFHRMHCDFIFSFINPVRKLVYSADDSIQFSALMIMEFIISSPKISTAILKGLGLPVKPSRLKSVQHKFCDYDVADSIKAEFLDKNLHLDDKLDSVEAKEMLQCENWLLNVVLQKLKKETTASIKIKSLQVIISMSVHFFMLISNLDDIALVLKNAILDSSPDVRLYATKCLDSIAYNMSNYLQDKESDEHSPSYKHFCLFMLPIAIEKIGEKSQTSSLKVCLCDFLSNIGYIIFYLLPPLIQANVLSFLSAIGSDVEQDSMVRAAAVRALAIYLLLPSLKKNLVFVENIAELTIPLATDPNVHVRIKAIWSIGNVSDALIKNCETASNERISKVILNRLIEVSIESCNDNDKVRCNSVRALGNLFSLITEEMLVDICYRKIFQKGVKKLVNCINAPGNAKVKWNSCYAIGCFMKNTALFKAISIYADFTWHISLFSILCNLIVCHSNFKVRINATTALTNISERSFFAENFGQCWCSLLTALEKSCNLSNYLEYNHRDKLQERLCTALSHFISLASGKDYLIMRRELVGRVEIIKAIWFRVVNRMTPENAAPLLSSPSILKKRISFENEQSREEKNAICYIAETFIL